MDTFEWKNPPPSRQTVKGESKFQPIVDQLAKHPGRWALIANSHKSSSHQTLKDKFGIEVTVRSTSDGRYDVYARFPAKRTRPIQDEQPQPVADARPALSSQGGEDFYTVLQLAGFLEISVIEIHKLNYTGKGPRFYRVKDEIRYRPADIGEWLAKTPYQSAGSSLRA